MARPVEPFELIFNHTGTAELVDARNNILWASDDDQDFKDEFSDEFLVEDDLVDVIDYLEDHDIIDNNQAENFRDGSWDCPIESINAEDLTEDDDNETDVTDLDEDD